MLLAIDPGNVESAYVVVDKNLKPIEFGKIPNEDMLPTINSACFHGRIKEVAIEMVACYGMPVGKEVFDTCVWIGRFVQEAEGYANVNYVYRKDEKIHICGNMRAKDSNIRQALIDRFGVVGTKKDKGWFYGFKGDIWSSYAVAVTYKEMRKAV